MSTHSRTTWPAKTFDDKPMEPSEARRLIAKAINAIDQIGTGGNEAADRNLNAAQRMLSAARDTVTGA